MPFMLTHIVMWRLKETALGLDKASNLARAQALLQSCAKRTPGILQFEVAVAAHGMECTYDLLLNSQFVDTAALQAYQIHPDHLAIKPFMREVVLERQCMDYETLP